MRTTRRRGEAEGCNKITSATAKRPTPTLLHQDTFADRLTRPVQLVIQPCLDVVAKVSWTCGRACMSGDERCKSPKKLVDAFIIVPGAEVPQRGTVNNSSDYS